MSTDSNDPQDEGLSDIDIDRISGFSLGDLLEDRSSFAFVHPEILLWASVIKTYFDDAKWIRKRGQARARFERESKDLVDAITSYDTIWICDLIGVDHGYIVRKLVEVLFEKEQMESL